MNDEEKLARRGGKQRGWGKAPRLGGDESVHSSRRGGDEERTSSQGNHRLTPLVCRISTKH